MRTIYYQPEYASGILGAVYAVGATDRADRGVIAKACAREFYMRYYDCKEWPKWFRIVDGEDKFTADVRVRDVPHFDVHKVADIERHIADA